MKLARLMRYQRDPMYRIGWWYYQQDCRVYTDENRSKLPEADQTELNEKRLMDWVEKRIIIAGTRD
ncbi:MAG: hypothetical protein JRJ39_00105 [Deltaproteobacteria bacterium]|nr:hypothetical protein [Deltaproteobacteria bacterium]